MIYRNSLFVLLTMICLFCTHPAGAQDKRALVQKLIEVTDMAGQIKSGAHTATAPLMEQIKKSNPTMPDDTFNYIQNKVQNEMSNILGSFMDQWGYKVWEQTFNDKELQYVIDFYSSETGKRFVQMMPIMTQQLMTHLPGYLQESLPKIKNAVMQAAADKKYNIRF